MRLFVVSRLVALLGFLLTACRALLAVAMATQLQVQFAPPRYFAIVIMVAVVVVGRTLGSRTPDGALRIADHQ
jgi:hypothetical protein